MEAFLRKQTITQGLLDRFWENLMKTGKDNLTETVLRSRLTLLETYWKRFEDGYYELAEHDNPLVQDFMKDNAPLIASEHNYITFKARILSMLQEEEAAREEVNRTRASTSVTAPVTASVGRQIQLPKISLPSFSGDQLAWEGFRDLFQSLVGDVADLAPVQKLQYLKASLSGEAAAVVANVELSDEGYETAWSDLVSRYDNKRVLLATHMRAFLSNAPIVKPSATELKRLTSVALQAQRSFASLGRPVVHWDDWFIHVIVEKLDSPSRLNWEASLQTSTEFPTFRQLQDFLQTRVRSLEAANFKPTTASVSSTKVQDRKPAVNSLTTTTSGSMKAVNRCSICQGNHAFSYCPRFKELPATQRREHVKKQGACFNCLKQKHAAANCPSSGRCYHCQGKHHSFLHISGTSAASKPELPDNNIQRADNSDTGKETSPPTTVNSNVAALAASPGNPILLSTALVTCTDGQDNSIVVRALLDSGSEASFVSERVAQTLKLPRRHVHVKVMGVQGASSGAAKQSVTMTIGSPRDDSVRLQLPAVFVLPRLTSVLPSRQVQRHDWPHLKGLDLADPQFDQPAKVDAIFGADVYGYLLREGIRRGPIGTPSAQATALGWVLMGPAPSLNSEPAESPVVSVNHALTAQVNLDQSLQRFWELEEVKNEPILSPEDSLCESLFAATHTRNLQGRYTVRLPKRKETDVRLNNNRREALNMLVSSERRLMRNPGLREQYVTFMNEYQKLGHMRPVPALEIHRKDVYYLPHHAVFKASSPVDKIRVVFNASSRTSTGFALNDLLLPGPKLQSELWLILTRWRLYRYVFTTDIVKMFRQILVHPEDVDMQRILWRPDPAKEVQDFHLLTVVYGTASAPYLALRTLMQLADDERSVYPLGSAAIKIHSYVDDILAGGHTLDHALETQRQLVALLASGGFDLSKWAANVPALCPDGESADKLFRDPDGVSTLGVLWSPTNDSFVLRVVSYHKLDGLYQKVGTFRCGKILRPAWLGRTGPRTWEDLHSRLVVGRTFLG